MVLVSDFSTSTALVVEENNLVRAVLVRMLQEMGFSLVTQANKPSDAAKKIEARHYDFIFCEYHFHSTPYNGQSFLEDVRQNKLVPLSTSFFMVTHEAAKGKVVEALEAALDSYILKPFNFNQLSARLRESRARKHFFKQVFEYIEAGDVDASIQLCEQLVLEESKYWVNAARIGAELCLGQGEFKRATRLFDKVATSLAVPWSKLGLARVDLEEGHT